MAKLHIKKGDTVKVLTGDDKGKTGKVVSVQSSTMRAIVEGVNIVSKHTKPNAASPQGRIIKKESTIHISNLMVLDSKGVASKVGRKLNEKNVLVRYSKKSNEILK